MTAMFILLIRKNVSTVGYECTILYIIYAIIIYTIMCAFRSMSEGSRCMAIGQLKLIREHSNISSIHIYVYNAYTLHKQVHNENIPPKQNSAVNTRITHYNYYIILS